MITYNLNDLIDKYGKPDALIDNWSTNNSGYAIWGFKDTITWNDSGIIKSGQKMDASMDTLQSIIDDWKRGTSCIAAVGFISYNFKKIIYNHIKFKNYNNNSPLLFFGNPKIIKEYKLGNCKASKLKIRLKKDIQNYKKYEKKIKAIKDELQQGNAYQINYTVNKIYGIDISDPFELYLYLRNQIKPKHGYYMQYNDMNILSFSPELFFKKENNIIQSSPMKGTRLRSENHIIDNKLKLELKNAPKDKAEHLMIVDLLRNDIGKIAIPGSVIVEDLFKVESHHTVHQMISNIKGKVKNSIKEIDIISALFPGGSITGAPKESAMKIIDNLENYNRNIYTGTLGYIKSNGDLNFNIAIRTLMVKDKQGIYPVGGGIVWDSNPKDEWLEAQLKSKILNSIVE
tara:strand:- start:575 stop:1774 length:1200 start_codon:yes stop_codon:yes gene_type:complete